jgi:putative methyltransferase (TIGR04325 family)
MHSPAPVVIFAYKRPVHLARTLSALSLNKEASDTKLFIYCDHAPEGADQETLRQIELTRNIAHRENRFKSVQVIERPENFGLARNVMSGVSEVISEYGCVIVLEDDLLVSVHFLKFMNDALARYGQHDEVACISGYVYPLEAEPASAFFIRGADCWGWATWKDKWSLLDQDASRLIDEIEKRRLQDVLDFNGSYPYMQMLRNRKSGANQSWAILWYASSLVNNRLCLYPSRSLVRNIGNDGSGTHHLEWSDAYDVNIQEGLKQSWPERLEESAEGRRLFERFFNGLRPSLAKRIKSKLSKYAYALIRKRNENTWSGNYASWKEAESDCVGYDNESILQQVRAAVRKVVNGEAAFERDGIAFEKLEYSEHIRSILESAFLQKKAPLNVLDFGGSLGSLYFQYRKLLTGKIGTWNIVEQSHFVQCGRSEFEDDKLKFYFTIEEVLQKERPDVLILSSVICYLDNPHHWMEKFRSAAIPHVIIDRTAFIQGAEDRLTVQQVPDSIYKASYPAWFLNEEKFLRTWITDYNIAGELPDVLDGTADLNDTVGYFKGYYFVGIK